MQPRLMPTFSISLNRKRKVLGESGVVLSLPRRAHIFPLRRGLVQLRISADA
jgi:hypothetical protein